MQVNSPSYHHRSLFIFRRDLRLTDNTGLLAALSQSKEVVAGFIFDPRQIDSHPYQSECALRFMVESLADLEAQLCGHNAKLYLFEGQAEEIVRQVILAAKIAAVYVNEDYTPFSRARDGQISRVCQGGGVKFYSYHDCTLNPPDSVKKDDGGVYTVFTPYARKARQRLVPRPQPDQSSNFYSGPIPLEKRALYERLQSTFGRRTQYPGGRRHALSIVKGMGRFKQYTTQRDLPALNATTKLSAHLKFGTCSIREVYQAVHKHFGPEHTLISELYWRDFFTQIGFHFPHVLGQSFHQEYRGLVWDNDPVKFRAWCQGRTGFPIVDAGMRELNETGFMHNRVRMITASFLVKDLHIDWRWGEQYFAQKLVDYDPLVNNGNWQWAASTGCDAQPYFRIFNPWLQQKKFDPQALYIKRWVPELKSMDVKDIHQIVRKQRTLPGYIAPIVSHDQERVKALARYRRSK